MSKFIDADRLKAEIGKKKPDYTKEAGVVQYQRMWAYNDVLTLIDSLQKDETQVDRMLCSQAWWEEQGWIMIPPDATIEGIDSLLRQVRKKFQQEQPESRIMTREMIEGRLLQNDMESWNEDYRAEDIQTRFAFYTYKDDSSVLYLSNVFVEETSRNHGFGTRILKAAEKAAEAIGAITISLKVKQDSPANAWYRKNGYGYVAFEDGYDWLEKNLEYLKPKKEVDWSEEDEDMLNSCISSIEEAKENRYAYKETDGDTSYDHEISWLKSLRPSWKPTAEQMEALKYAVKLYKEIHFENFHQRIESLYEQLKKMM